MQRQPGSATAAASLDLTAWPQLQILHRHPDFIVCYKPAGLSFHSEQGPGMVVLAEALYGKPLYAVHRLDKTTSGLLLLATHPHSAARFTAMFSAHDIEKYYLALSLSKGKRKQGWVKGDMQPARRGAWKLLPSMLQPAVSYFFSFAWPVLRDNGDALPRVYPRVYMVKPFSGKTHQVRVALKSNGSAILGDSLYQATSADRVYLHAFGLKFHYQGDDFAFTTAAVEGEWFAKPELQHWLASTMHAPWTLPWPKP
jgi:tRNA pseudouridine32 synthase/23S rRNA pseudouridine746 synthase